MPAPYYSDESVTLYLGDSREITEWAGADVLVTDPPYGIGWHLPTSPSALNGGRPHAGIIADESTAARDDRLATWGSERPAVVFGSPLAALPRGARAVLVWRKPPDTGYFGSVAGWRRDWEAVYLLGKWPNAAAARSGIIETRGGMTGYLNGHPHAKPVDLMVALMHHVPPGSIADPFAGSGTTLVAAKQLGRQSIGVEIDERYAEMAALRLAQYVFDFGGV